MRRYIVVTDYHDKNLDCTTIKEVFDIIKTLSGGVAFRISVYRLKDVNDSKPFITAYTDIHTDMMDMEIDYRILFEEELYDL